MHHELLETGSEGDEVTQWQESLNQVMHAGLATDGIFGHHTHEATVEFQHHHHLTADGIVGPHTHQAMEHALAALHAHAGGGGHGHADTGHGHGGHADGHAAHGDGGHAAHTDGGHAAHDGGHAAHADGHSAHGGAKHDDDDDDGDDDKKGGHGGVSASLDVKLGDSGHASVSAGGGHGKGSDKGDDKDDDKKGGGGSGVSVGFDVKVDINTLLSQLASAWHALVTAGQGQLTCKPLHTQAKLDGCHKLGDKTITLTYHGRNSSVYSHHERAPQYGSSTVPIHLFFDYGTNGKDHSPLSVHVSTADDAAAGAGSKITIQAQMYPAAPMQTETNGKKHDLGVMYVEIDINEECTFAENSHNNTMLCIYGDGRHAVVTHDKHITVTPAQ